MHEDLSRRLFLQGSGTVAGAALMKVGIPGVLALAQTACSARDADAGFKILSTTEAREFEAIAARILPTTDTPGAREAGAVWFMDTVYGSIFARDLPRDRAALKAFQGGVEQDFPGVHRFSDLAEADQDTYLASREQTAFFQNMRFLTIAGVFGMSLWGGNRENVGWKLIGMDTPPHGWQPPFGYYDKQHMEEAERGD